MRLWGVENWIAYPIFAQRNVLQHLVTQAQYTEIGRKYRFSRMFTVKDFKARVPIHEYDDLKPYIEFALKAFGENRCFCGGDWPVSLLAGSYFKIWQAYKTILKELLNKEALEKVFCQNAFEFYRLKQINLT